MKQDEKQFEEKQLTTLLTTLDADRQPPEPELKGRLRAESAAAFSAAFATSASDLPIPSTTRRSPMVLVAIRAAIAVTAASLAVAFGLWTATETTDPVVALQRSLTTTGAATSLHLKLVRADKPEDIWVRRPARLRWNRVDGTYQIVHGKRSWEVDERVNQAVPRSSLLFESKRQMLDVLALLDIPVDMTLAKPAAKEDVAQVRRDGRTYDLYRICLPGPNATYELEALVDPATQLLKSLQARVRRDGRLAPLAQLDVLAVNQPIDDQKFVVGDCLTEDGRIGKVVDVQGVAAIKPVMHGRWTPVSGSILIKPGDWLRTDPRGANAVQVRLTTQAVITLGPGSMVEFPGPDRIRLLRGELQVTAVTKRSVTLLTAKTKETISTSGMFRLKGETLETLDNKPPWLQGFLGTVVQESLGRLVAKVDGRDMPLTVGYHKVSVDIRDQIARTVVEESFVNHTNAQLEGVFYFPLPQDASISAFGMWINGQLVRADVVEKQRAREIYETILRERRDPGLLEWSGGNLFKARVFPIFAHSEKRVTITYTQVLPRRRNRYQYSYALQSEMLRQHPLRELAIDVKIHSTQPLANVHSPTHTARIAKTHHSAHVEFDAQQYSPTRDFEVVVQLEAKQPNIVVIPHRRGEDGYFMMQVMPPGADDNWQRNVLPDGKPLELLILADTSASIDLSQRRDQAQLIASLLGSLTPKDRFNLSGCDVNCDWVFDKPVAATTENVERARVSIQDRVSLGWTDLDKAFASALKQSGKSTQVIYIGDGIGTIGNANPEALAKRLQRRCEGEAAGFHAISVGNTFEPIVLKSIASLGGGTVRQINGERTPQAVALQLLGEITRPSIRNLKVEFQGGLRVARVYPRQLPNLPAGTQQILLGRYLPTGDKQPGTVVITGTRDGQPVRFSADVTWDDSQQTSLDTSFIPRLWARMHLDALLQQGSSAAIRDEIITLSEQYHIMTPYTSFLVLETDADRERFKVKRRFQMRDAQKFFADGRDTANYQLIQQQIKLAGNWRTNLRRSVLRRLETLGRSSQAFNQRPVAGIAGGRSRDFGRLWSFSGDNGTVITDGLSMPDRLVESDESTVFGPSSEMWGSLGIERKKYKSRDLLFSDGSGDYGWNAGDRESSLIDAQKIVRSADASMDFDQIELWDKEGNSDLDWKGDEIRDKEDGSLSDSRIFTDSIERLPKDSFGSPSVGGFALPYYQTRENRSEVAQVGFGDVGLQVGGAAYGYSWRESQRPAYARWFDQLFPKLPTAAPERLVERPKSRWPKEARAIANSLLRTGTLSQLQGGLQITRTTTSFDPRWNQRTSQSSALSLVSPDRWLIRSSADGGQTLVRWCDGRRRAIFSVAFQLGRQRPSRPKDLQDVPLTLSGHVMTSLERAYRGYVAAVSPAGQDRILLTLKPENRRNTQNTIQILVDTGRHVIVQFEHRNEDKITSSTKFSRFIDVAGVWWASRIESFDANASRTLLITQQFQQISAEALRKAMNEQLAGLGRVQLVHQPLPDVVDAKQAVADKKPTFDDQLALVLHFTASQQWDRVLDHLQGVERLIAKKPGVRWIRYGVLRDRRRNEELKNAYLQEATRLAQQQTTDDFFLADVIRHRAAGVLAANEMLELLDVLKPVYQRQPAYRETLKSWVQLQVSYLTQTGQAVKALGLQTQMATEYPDDANVQQQYAQALFQIGRRASAYEALDRALANRDAKWSDSEEDLLRNSYAQLLRSEGRYDTLTEFLAVWVAQSPSGSSAYQQYLTALIRMDRTDKANRLMSDWLAQAKVKEKLSSATSAKLQAAVSQMLGNGYNMYANRMDPQWQKPLADAVRYFARQDVQLDTANRIMGNSTFRRADACRAVRKKVADLLVARIDTLSPMQIQYMINWISQNDPAVSARMLTQIGDGMRKRWATESDPDVRHQLGATLARVLRKVGTAPYLEYLHRQVQEGPKENRTAYVKQLFNFLTTQPWTVENEDEAFDLLQRIYDSKDPAQKLTEQIRYLYQLTDRMVKGRYEIRMHSVEHPENLTRTELRDRRVAFLKAARQGLADHLGKAARGCSKPLSGWMVVERLYLDIRTGRDLDRVAQSCWEIVGPAPRTAASKLSDVQKIEELRRGRCLVMLANLAARRGADPSLVSRLLDYFAKGIEAHRAAGYWKLLTFELLVALDRPEQLQKLLQQWIGQDDPDNRWRVSLAYLLAEQGKIKQAIALMEKVKTDDQLGPADYRALANWYMAVDRRDEYEQALVNVFKTMQEWKMNDWLNRHLRPWQQRSGRMPDALDKNVLRIFAALFQKSRNPENYMSYLQQYYLATRDFRLLETLADSVVGHTAGQVYPLLGRMQSVLAEVRDEATVDSIVEHLRNKTRPRASTDVDHRALDLLELAVERRAAELLDQPGPHADKALAAMKRAFDRKWSDGEPRQVAGFLASLGQIPQKSLADEQLRELGLLHQHQPGGTIDHLMIGLALARCHWSYSRRDAAVDLLESELQQYEMVHAGVLPTDANDTLSTLVGYLEQMRHYAHAEQLLLQQLEHPANEQQKVWLKNRLYQLYQEALSHNGLVTLGTGQTLYQAVQHQLLDQLNAGDPSYRQSIVGRLCSFYRVAQQKKLKGVLKDLNVFAFQRLPHVLKMQADGGQQMVSNVAGVLHDLAGPLEGIRLLVTRIETEPAWLQYADQDGWNRFGWNLAYWRQQVKDLGELDSRLLKVVTDELRRDLQSRRARQRQMYHCHISYFWKERIDAFAETAEQVYRKTRESGRSVQYIATYLFDGLQRYDRAIEILFIALQDRILDETGQAQLVGYLHQRNRFGESIGLLQQLVKHAPHTLNYRVQLMHAYFKTKRNKQLLDLLAKTDKYFHEDGCWGESPAATLAASCLANQLYQPSVAYYREAIKLHEETHPGRGIGNGTLSTYYRSEASAYIGLAKSPGISKTEQTKATSQAVDAAASAVISWGSSHKNRKKALAALRNVLAQAPDLDAFVAEMNRQAEQTGLHSPILHKAIGMVWLQKNQPEKALEQLKLAVELQPNDLETRKMLITCYDRLKDSKRAAQQVLEMAQQATRDIQVYRDLGDRYRKLARPGQAERAYTSIVEVLPNESESHALLAEIRQQQDRWEEAIVQWQQVTRIRSLEPTGLLKLAAAQIHQKQTDQARQTINRLRCRAWPVRFKNIDAQLRTLEAELDRTAASAWR